MINTFIGCYTGLLCHVVCCMKPLLYRRLYKKLDDKEVEETVCTVYRSRVYDPQQKSGLSKWFILVSPIGAIALGILWAVVFKGTVVEGAWGYLKKWYNSS